MFSTYFDPQKINALLSASKPSTNEVEHLLLLKKNSLAQVAKLILASSQDELRQLIIDAAKKSRTMVWQNQLFLMPPLYISNGDSSKGGCLDHCLYCPWRNGNVPKEKLLRLTPEETRVESAALITMGYGDIELVAATDPLLFHGEKAAQYIAAAKNAGARHVGVNFFPLSTREDYKMLAREGCTFSIVWQETYDPEVYKTMHTTGPKSNMLYRLDAHDRALQGGIPAVGIAFLGGLTDWRYETLAAIQHARYLQKKYNAHIIFGMPRWKFGQGLCMKTAPQFYGDQEYELVGALYSLSIPGSLVWFSTREHFDLSARCARGGGCVFTLDCSTEVGGYSRQNGFAQFPVYSCSYQEGVGWLKKIGFTPQIHLPW
ncbi:MAG: radical SAM protein [Patescibacteria group bacterium]